MEPSPPVTPDATRRHLPALLLLFVGSGCAALVYEVVWFQLLSAVIGSSAVSLGVLLGTFMGGMCLGSLFLPWIVSAGRHPLRVYAVLELGIAAFGVLLLHGMPYVSDAYVARTGGGLAGRAVVAAICLLPPTLMMGATLPAAARWVRTSPDGVAWLGFFYGGNIAGAVLGSLLAGFVLLRLFDTQVATYVAMALNVLVAWLALAVAQRAPHEAPVAETERAERAPGAAAVYVVIALSGFTALSAEVIWTRLLGLLFGGSVYTFSMILAVFLAGLGIGSAVGAALARRSTRPRALLALCQLLLCGALAW
ncbi:MAG: spermidine synthase family protein, partial [Planctomycetota bacterium]